MTNKLVVWDEMPSNSQNFSREAIIEYLNPLTFNLNMEYVNLDLLADKILSGFPGEPIERKKFVQYVAEVISELTSTHPDYSKLAARVEIRQLHKTIGSTTFCKNLAKLA